MPLRDYQQKGIDCLAAEFRRGAASAVLSMATGCHAKGQEIMMFDMTRKRVEDVEVGDKVMGPDSRPRSVLALCRGRQEMVRVVPIKGDSFVVNLDHILTLIHTTTKALVDISVRDWFATSPNFKHLHKLVRTGVDPATDHPPLPVDPYVLGALIGDGCLKRCVNLTTPDEEIHEAVKAEAARFGLGYRRRDIHGWATLGSKDRKGRGRGIKGNRMRNAIVALGLDVDSPDKFIPDTYLRASRSDRMHLLAGLIDTDGCLTSGCFDWISASRRLADDFAFLVRSVGLAGCVRPCEKRCQTGAGGTYYRVCVSGNIDAVPCRVPRKRAAPRRQKRDAMVTGFECERLPADDYYGFMLDGDGRYLLSDCTITHNSGKSLMFRRVAEGCAAKGNRSMLIVHGDALVRQAAKHFQRSGLSVGIEMGDQRPYGNEQVVVASIDTLWRRLDRYPADTFKIIQADECFPAGTLVDGKPIEQIKVGDLVRSYNEETREVEMRPVVRLFKSPARALVRLTLEDGRMIVCTEGHPMAVRGCQDVGYVPALHCERRDLVGDFEESDGVLSRCFYNVEEVVHVDAETHAPDGFVYNIEVAFNHNYFVDGLLVHNCHHTYAVSWLRTLAHFGFSVPAVDADGNILDEKTKRFGDARLVGYTATPDRGDKRDIMHVFESVAFEYGIRDAIDDGWLVPVRQELCTLDGLDLSKVRKVAGDLSAASLGKALVPVLEPMAQAIAEVAGTSPCLIYSPLVALAEQMTKILRRIDSGRRVETIIGDTDSDTRKAWFDLFERGLLARLSSVGVLTEGVDLPAARVAAMCRLTMVRALYAQMVGRILRLPPGVDQHPTALARKAAIASSSKPHAIVLDFAGNASKHKLCRLADLLADDLPDGVRDMAVKKTMELGGDPFLGIQAALEEIKKMEAAMAGKTMQRSIVDPFDLFDVSRDKDTWERPATIGQLTALANYGIIPFKKGRTEEETIAARDRAIEKAAKAFDFKQASRLLDRVGARSNNHLASVRQIRMLMARGVSKSRATSMTFADASKAIDELEVTGWKPTSGWIARWSA